MTNFMSDLDPRGWPDETDPTVAVLTKLVQDSHNSLVSDDSMDLVLRHIETARRSLLRLQPPAEWVEEA